MATRIYVTQPLADPGFSRIKAAGDVRSYPHSAQIAPKQDVIEGVRDAEVLCCLLQDSIDAEVLDAAKNLKLIVTGAVHPMNLDIARASARGIAVTGIPNLIAEATADLEWSLLMSLSRRIVEADNDLRQGVFPGSQSVHFAGGQVYGRTLGTIGFGAIGQGIARRAHGFGMKVLYTKPTRLPEAEEQELGVEYRTQDDLLRESDFVCLNATFTPETRHLIGERELSLMQESAYLINVSRGPMVDEAALVAALKAKRIRGVALDVFEFEPMVAPELLAFKNTVLTPHLGSATVEMRQAISDVMADNVEAFVAGKELSYLLNGPQIGR